MLADSKFARLSMMPKHYFANVARVKAIAAETKMQIVPALFQIGYSNDLLSQDPNLAEGLPVRDAPFVVEGGKATLKPEKSISFRPKFDFVDEGVKVDAAAHAATVSNHTANARLNQKLKLTP